MANYRRGRINDAISKELSIALREARDPRIASALVSVTHADVSADLKVAKIYFSSMGDKKEVLSALRSASGMLRRHLAMTLNLRITPELLFYPDSSIEHGAHIAELLHGIEAERKANAEDEP